MRYPWSLNYWNTGEWQVVNERLHDMEKAHEAYNPSRQALFRSLQLVKQKDVRVVILGRDPYPDARYSTGVAFSIPAEEKNFPLTLKSLLQEYSTDSGYPIPSSGFLEEWCKRGVLLWNAIPSCAAGRSLSHDWDEYSYLTREILTRLSAQGGIVFAFLGTVARRYVEEVDKERNKIILTSHPSPRGSLNSNTPFRGSRVFTRINEALIEMGQTAIDWELKDESISEAQVQGSDLA